LKLGKFFTRWEESDDGRVAFRKGGRAGDVFYRDRWSHDKVVRSTHGVNCTGSCSYTIGLVLLTITASGALLFTLFGIRRRTPATA
jgi:nitrate reductase alpha subunit